MKTNPPLWNPPPANTFKAFLKSFVYAFNGIKLLISSQRNARIHLLASILVTGAGFLCEISLTEWLVVLVCMGGVWMGEAMNSAIEVLTDLVSPEINEKAGQVKDMAASAVLLFVIFCVIIGIIIFAPKIYALIVGW